ncbi:MAG: OmpA family protein [Bacteroidota bacterium]
MKRFKTFGLALFLLGLTSGLLAQPITKANLKTMLRKAEESIANRDYYNALDWYQKAYEEDRNFDIAYKIAQMHFQLRDYAKAQRWFRRIVNKRSRKTPNPYMPDARFTHGLLLKYLGKYQEARAEFQLYIGEAEDIEKIRRAKIEITGCDLALEMDDQAGISIENAGKKVNSKYSEYSPVLVNDRDLYFTGFRRNEVLVLDGKEEDIYSKVFVATREEDGFAEAQELPSDNISREGFHIGNLTVSPDASTMYFTRAQLGGNDLSSSKIYASNMGDEGWGPAQEIDGLNGNYIVKQPTVGELFGNEVLIFASNMDGGFGGYDLYYSTRSGDGYTSPVNMGETINSKGDEETPYYVDGTLYFSSNGHPGIGGFDIFSSLWNGSNWSEPANIGKPYNSSVDDLYFTIDAEGYNGFVVSNRPGTRSVKSKTCCNDIWVVQKEQIVLELLATMYADGQPLDSVSVSFADYTNDEIGEVRNRLKPDTNLYSFALVPDKAYRLVARRDGYFPDSVEFNTVGVTASQVYERQLNLKLIPRPEPKPVPINEPIRMENIYYDFEDDKILSDAEKDLTFIFDLMNKYDDMVIELGSHTDARGTTRYNENLSQRRADSAKRWLVERGIAEERIVAVGYGESVILNRCVNGVKCSDEEHRYNRRTEFKITAGPTTIQIER